MYKIVVIGYGQMCADIILGIKDFGAEVVGVVLDEQIKNNTLVLNLKRFFLPSFDYSFIKNLKLKEIKVKSVNSEKFKKEILKLNPDFIFVASWSEKLKNEIINLPKIAAINVHPSLLPKYRGANPYQRVIMNGEKKSGVTFHLMTENFDSGAILLQKEIEIVPSETGGSLKNKTCVSARTSVCELLKSLSEEIIVPISQNESEATYFPQIDENDVIIDFKKTAEEIDAKLRGLSPWACGYFNVKGYYFKITKYKILEKQHNSLPSTVLQRKKNTLEIALQNNKSIYLMNLKGMTSIETFFIPIILNALVKKGDMIG